MTNEQPRRPTARRNQRIRARLGRRASSGSSLPPQSVVTDYDLDKAVARLGEIIRQQFDKGEGNAG